MDSFEAFEMGVAPPPDGAVAAEGAASDFGGALDRLAQAGTKWISPEGLDQAVAAATAAADGLRQKGLAAAKDKAKLFDLNALQADDPFMASAGDAAPAREADDSSPQPDAAAAAEAPSNAAAADDAHRQELARVKERALRDARKAETASLHENRRLAAALADATKRLEALQRDDSRNAASAESARRDAARARRDAANASEEADQALSEIASSEAFPNCCAALAPVHGVEEKTSVFQQPRC